MCAALLNQTDLDFSVSGNQQNEAIGTTVIYLRKISILFWFIWEQSQMLKVKSEEKLWRWLGLHQAAFVFQYFNSDKH